MGIILFIIDQEADADTPAMIPDLVVISVLYRNQVPDAHSIIKGEEETAI